MPRRECTNGKNRKNSDRNFFLLWEIVKKIEKSVELQRLSLHSYAIIGKKHSREEKDVKKVFKYGKKRAFIINFTYFLIILAAAFLLIKFGLPLIAPFVIGLSWHIFWNGRSAF